MWRIGGDADGPYGFTRIVGGTFMRNGQVAVFESNPQGVRLYDKSGKHVLSFGRAGRGPGEFEEVMRFVPHVGDSLVVSQVARVSVFDHAGKHARTIPTINSVSGYAIVVRMFANGTMLARDHATPPRVRTEGTRRETGRMVILSPRADVVTRDLGERLFGETIIARYGGALFFTGRAFAAENLLEGGDSLVFSSPGDSARLDVLSARTGQLLRTIAFDLTQREVTARDREEFARSRRAEVRSERWRQGTEAFLKIMPYPERMPYFDMLRWSFDDVVRLRRYVAPLDTSAQWLSITSAGRLLSVIDLPKKLSVLDFDGDRVLVVERDADDLEYVALYRLARLRSPPAG